LPIDANGELLHSLFHISGSNLTVRVIGLKTIKQLEKVSLFRDIHFSR
jgi:hypothetical protein